MCIHDFAVKYMTATWAVMGGILKILHFSQILLLYFIDRLYLSIVVTGNKYCRFGRFFGGA